MINRIIKLILIYISALFLSCSCVNDSQNNSEIDFFDPVVPIEKIYEYIDSYPFTNFFTDEYEFEYFDIDIGTDNLIGMCVSDEYIYISDYKNHKVHVLNKSFEPVSFILRGAPDRSLFSPCGITTDKNGNLYVLSHSVKNTAEVNIYDADNKYVDTINFTFKMDEYTRPDDIAVTDDGNIYFTVRSDIKKDGLVYNILPNNNIKGIGNGSFGYLCASADGSEAVFVNGSYALIKKPDGGYESPPGLPALYKIKNDTVTAVKNLPASINIPYSDDDKKYFIDYLNEQEIEYDNNDLEEYLTKAYYGINAMNGYEGLAESNGEYYIAVGINSAVYVYDDELNYKYTIKIPTKKFNWKLNRMEDGREQIAYMDADKNGDLYFLIESRIIDYENPSGSFYGSVKNYYGMRAYKK